MTLDTKKIYEKYDLGRVGESIEMLDKQMSQVYKQAESLKVPASYKNITHLVVNGMGGSNIGVSLISSALSDQIKVPVIITPGYEVPAMVNEKTLYLISSYSGNTEEPLSVYEEVKKRGAKVLAICEDSDNKLARLMKEDNIPGLKFTPSANPSGQPRLGLGYSIFGVVILLNKAGLIKINEAEVENIITSVAERNSALRRESSEKVNQAKRLALKLYQKIPIIVGAEFLSGNLKILRNQFNETSKNFAAYLELPDMNHYAMEGLLNPKSNKDNLVFLFIDSEFYHPRVQKRADLTKEVIKKNGISCLEIKLGSGTKLGQAFEMLQFGCWLTYYLAMLNAVNPVEIKWVEWFKKQLG